MHECTKKQQDRVVKAVNRLLIDQGMTKLALAKKLEICPNVVTYWLGRQRLPTYKQAMDMEALSGFTISRQEFAPHVYD